MPGILGPGSPWSLPVKLVTLLRGVGESQLDRRTETRLALMCPVIDPLR
jgi:hypothetical protein